MKLALLGVGNAGVRLVDQLHGAEGPDNPISNGNVLVINTTPSTFAETSHIEDHRQVLIGDTHPDVYQPEVEDVATAEDVSANEAITEKPDQQEGVAGDPVLGVEVAREDLPEIRRALDSVDDTEVDAAMIIAGLGGGTGCGVGSVLLEELVSIYEIPVYVLGVLPSAAESDQRAWTAARAIRTVVPMADAVLAVDNETWHEGEEYAVSNEAVIERLLSLFGAGEDARPPLPELRMDPNDIKRTLAVGGVSTVGYVRTDLSIEPVGWFEKLRRLLGFGAAKQPAKSDATTIKNLVEQALESKLTLPCDISTTDRVLLILSGPPRELSRKGFETGRSVLEAETGTVEILAGDNPDPEATAVSATVLLANVTGVERIKTLQERALGFERQRDEPTESDTEETDADSHGFEFEGEPTLKADADDEKETVGGANPEMDRSEDDDSGENVESETVENVIAEAEPAVETPEEPTEDEQEPTEDEQDTDESVKPDEDADEDPAELTEPDEDGDSDTAESAASADESSDESEPTIKDPFANPSTMDEANQ